MGICYRQKKLTMFINRNGFFFEEIKKWQYKNFKKGTIDAYIYSEHMMPDDDLIYNNNTINIYFKNKTYKKRYKKQIDDKIN